MLGWWRYLASRHRKLPRNQQKVGYETFTWQSVRVNLSTVDISRLIEGQKYFGSSTPKLYLIQTAWKREIPQYLHQCRPARFVQGRKKDESKLERGTERE